ncbi:ATP-dependent helicase HrpB [Aliidiomarina sanyensis]|nr:ATP-dependent helicase HrpB [Aliidiomarina sanyensis]
MNSELPVMQLLPAVRAALPARMVVLQAPPGAGKSTALPLALLTEGAFSKQIILIQPRRVAALNIARYLAQQLNEPVGETVGYWVRQDRKATENTRLLVVTDGMFTQMIQGDPSLSNVDLIIFDEFHERNLACDLGLALALEARELRDDLGVLVMSATIPADALATWLQGPDSDEPCEVLVSEGRTFPVSIHYRPALQMQRWFDALSSVLEEACQCATQGVLVFLPGIREINGLRQRLESSAWLQTDSWRIMELHGRLPLSQQAQVLAPLGHKSQRKLVLATNLAETSVTIPDIDVVVDSGRERQARYLDKYLQTQLQTRMISLASAEQRAGRAGRVQAGHCFRLWSESQSQGMAKFSSPALALSDLTPIILEAAVWGVGLEQLRWFSAPPATSIRRGVEQLQRLGLIDAPDPAVLAGKKAPNLTAKGRRAQQFGTEIHVAALLAEVQITDDPALKMHAALLAAHLDENEWQRGVDVLVGLHAILTQPKVYPRSTRRFHYWCHRLQIEPKGNFDSRYVQTLALQLEPLWLARAAIGTDGSPQPRFQLATGLAAEASAELVSASALSNHRADKSRNAWVVVTQLTLQEDQANAMIRQGIPLQEAQQFDQLLASAQKQEHWQWQGSQGRLVCTTRYQIGALTVHVDPKERAATAEEREHALVSAMQDDPGLALFASEHVTQFLRRVGLAAQHLGIDPADWQPPKLLAELPAWAALYLRDCSTLRAARAWDPLPALQALLGYDEQQQLNHLLPIRWQAPSGRSHAVAYDEHGAAVVRLKLQEVFGEPNTPMLLAGTLPMTFELLSPAGRPLQRTQNLASFWQDGYPHVRKEMRGRYPKHPWPEDPLQALPSHKTKRALEP